MTSPRLGLDRDLRLAWLDAAAAISARRLSSSETQAVLMRALDGEVPGTTHGSGRGKTVTVLRRIWFSVPPDIAPLRERALALVTEGDRNDRLALHWSMLLATHPFFADFASVAGRLLALQGAFDRPQVRVRLAERWGDRSTLARAVPRMLASLSEWGVLALKGSQFAPRGKRLMASSAHAEILIEAAVLASPGQTASLQAIAVSPMLFPFDASAGIEPVRRGGRLVVHLEGLDLEMVSARRSREW